MRVMVCPPEAWDAVTATCTAPEWGHAVYVLPPLSASDGILIAQAAVLFWVAMFCIRVIRKASD